MRNPWFLLFYAALILLSGFGGRAYIIWRGRPKPRSAALAALVAVLLVIVAGMVLGEVWTVIVIFCATVAVYTVGVLMLTYPRPRE